MELLSKPERELLSWLNLQDRPVTLEQLEAAPSYSDQRRSQLLKNNMICTPNSGYLGTEPRTYAITDKGRAALEASRLTLGSDRRSKIALWVSILALAVSIAALFSGFV